MEGNCHFWVFSSVPATRSGCLYLHLEPVGAEASATSTVLTEAKHSRSEFGRQPLSRFSELRKPTASSRSNSLRAAQLAQAHTQGINPEVRMYCFRLANCGTFMPLSVVRGVFRIAVVWTQFVAAISAISSIHLNVLFTHAVVRLAVACE